MYLLQIFTMVLNLCSAGHDRKVSLLNAYSQIKAYSISARHTKTITSVAKCGRLDVISIPHQPNLPPESARNKLTL